MPKGPLVTHRSPECPEGRDSGFDCLIDLLQTVRQGVPAKLGGRGSISGRGGGGCGKWWECRGRELESRGGPKYQHPSMKYAGRGCCTRWGGERGEKKKTTKQSEKGKKKTASTPVSTPKRQEDNIGAHQARKPTQHEHTHTWHMALPENKAPIKEISVGKIRFTYKI